MYHFNTVHESRNEVNSEQRRCRRADVDEHDLLYRHILVGSGSDMA